MNFKYSSTPTLIYTLVSSVIIGFINWMVGNGGNIVFTVTSNVIGNG